jgi:phosphatidylglycerol---prolipoprotein diacylglyceryl transferase
MQQVLYRFRIPGIFPDGIPLYGYGLMLFVAFLACITVAGRLAKREGIAKEIVQDLAIWLFLGGLIGARTTFLLVPVEGRRPVSSIGDFFWQLPRLWDGGVIFYGAAIGGAIAFGLAYYFQLRKHDLSTWKVVDIIAPALALGLCFGRMGCLLNGCCYGDVSCPHCLGIRFPMPAEARFRMTERGYQTAAGFTLETPLFPGIVDGRTVAAVEPESPAAKAGLERGDVILKVNDQEVQDAEDLRHYLMNQDNWRGRGLNELGHGWTMELTVQKSNNGPQETLAFAPMTLPIHPTQVYESVSMLLLFLLLLAFYPFRRHDGEVMALLMIGYGLHRYFNEMLRADVRPTGFENWTSVLLVAGGLLIIGWLWRKPVQSKLDPETALTRAAS